MIDAHRRSFADIESWITEELFTVQEHAFVNFPWDPWHLCPWLFYTKQILWVDYDLDWPPQRPSGFTILKWRLYDLLEPVLLWLDTPPKFLQKSH